MRGQWQDNMHQFCKGMHVGGVDGALRGINNHRVTLAPISVYVMHKNLATAKIMEAMHTAYTKSRNCSQHISNYTRGKWSRRHASKIMKGKRISEKKLMLWKKVYFAESFDEPSGKSSFELRHSLLYLSLLVHISEFPYANFLSTCIQGTHLPKSQHDHSE